MLSINIFYKTVHNNRQHAVVCEYFVLYYLNQMRRYNSWEKQQKVMESPVLRNNLKQCVRKHFSTLLLTTKLICVMLSTCSGVNNVR